MAHDVFQSLWIGPRLSSMEVLSIESFLSFGYEYHLYVYDEVANVPCGVSVRDANEILPSRDIFYFRGEFAPGSPACFSDLWRYKLLLERGGWWVDTDVVCVRPFDFTDSHVVGQQRGKDGLSLNNAVIRAPQGSALAHYCFETCLRIDVENLVWGATGPKLIQSAIDDLGLECGIQPPEVFYDVDYDGIHELFQPHQLSPAARAVHLWQAIWKDRGLPFDGPFPSDSVYEDLRRRFLPAYQPPPVSDAESERIAARLQWTSSEANGKRRRRVRRVLRAVTSWAQR